MIRSFRIKGTTYVKVGEFRDKSCQTELRRGHASEPVLQDRVIKTYTVFKPSYAERKRMKDADYA